MYFTVFTPTYNRAYCLHRVYNTLKNQSFRDFEWVVVDDGSSDNTKDLVSMWMSYSDFKITYLYQENSGKHIAWNRAIMLAEGNYFLCIDSDDEFIPTALEVMHNSLISNNLCSGVGVLSKDQYGNKVGTDFPVDKLICTINDMHFKYGCVDGEKTFCIKVSILKNYLFPEILGLTHFPESSLWAQIGQPLIFINNRLRIYHTGGMDQITAKKVKYISTSHYLSNLITLNSLNSYFFYKPMFFIRNYGCLVRFGMHLRYTLFKVVDDVHGFFPKVLTVLIYPIGIALYLKDRVMRHK